MEELRFDSRIMHPEVQSVSRTGVTESLKRNRVTTPYFTKYEYVTLIGTRASKLQKGLNH